jgi:UDP-N-acetylglucosamine/UDP-N-acetylgalactosamine 4-epimerase
MMDVCQETASPYEKAKRMLRAEPKCWLVTGVAGFIGSHLLETLLGLGQRVVGIDNFSTGYRSNLEDVEHLVGRDRWAQFHLIEGDISSISDCMQAVHGADYVLHQAALGSVPRSVADPISSNKANVDGFLNMLVASRDAGVKRFVYASSSSVYGDNQDLPKTEDAVGMPLSPYAVTKRTNELYAGTFASLYGLGLVGLRYFNVFGPRQSPSGAYAAVIPRWIASLLQEIPGVINGDGETSRDFCFIANTVQANILSALTDKAEAVNQVYNVAVGERTSLNVLYAAIALALSHNTGKPAVTQPHYAPFRTGDVRHSLANIEKAKSLLGYSPDYALASGLEVTVGWFCEQEKRKPGAFLSEAGD